MGSNHCWTIHRNICDGTALIFISLFSHSLCILHNCFSNISSFTVSPCLLFFFPNVSLLPHSAPSWISSYAENLASSSLQDGATTWHYYLKEFISTCSCCCANLPTPSTTLNAFKIDYFSCLIVLNVANKL